MVRSAVSKWHWLWAAGIAAALSLHFWFPDVGAGPLDTTFSVESAGKKVLYLLAEEQLFFARRNIEPLRNLVPQLSEYDTLCLLGPARHPSPGEWSLLLEWVDAGGTLLIAPKYSEPVIEIEALDLKVETDLSAFVGEMLQEAGEGEGKLETRLLEGEAEVQWLSFGKIVGEATEVLIEYDGEPQAVVKEYGNGRVLLVSSDYIFSNRSLVYEDNGVLAFRLLEAAGEGSVVFDEYLNTAGAPRVVGLLFQPVFRPLTAQLLLILLLGAWCANRRFGPLLAQRLQARHDVAAHADALGNLYYKSRHGAHVVRRQWELLKSELHLKYAVAGKDERALQPLARRSGRDPAQIKHLLERAEAASRNPHLPRREAARLIQQLAALRRAALQIDSSTGRPDKPGG